MQPGQRVRVSGRPAVVVRSQSGAVVVIDRRGQLAIASPWEVVVVAVSRAPRSHRAQLPHWAGELAVLGPSLVWWRGRCAPLRCGADCSAPGASCG